MIFYLFRFCHERNVLGITLACSSEPMYLALVPNAVTPSCSLNSHKLNGVGLNGLPSKTRIAEPADNAPTSHGHIIHAQVVNWKKTSFCVKSQCNTCSFLS